MKKIFSAIALAAVTTAASWAVRKVLASRGNRRPHRQLESWENEGGALAPTHAPLATSQVPR
jgi:hypothetical protein